MEFLTAELLRIGVVWDVTLCLWTSGFRSSIGSWFSNVQGSRSTKTNLLEPWWWVWKRWQNDLKTRGLRFIEVIKQESQFVGRYGQTDRGGVLRDSVVCMAVLTEKLFNSLRHSGNCMYHQFNTQLILRSAHTVYLCVLCGYENKQRLFHCTALTDWFL